MGCMTTAVICNRSITPGQTAQPEAQGWGISVITCGEIQIVGQ